MCTVYLYYSFCCLHRANDPREEEEVGSLPYLPFLRFSELVRVDSVISLYSYILIFKNNHFSFLG